MNDNDIKILFSQEINGLDGKRLGELVLWFNAKPLSEIRALFGNNKPKLKELATIVALPWIEIEVDREKLDCLRDYADGILNWNDTDLILEAKDSVFKRGL